MQDVSRARLRETLQRLTVTVKLTSTHLAADPMVHGSSAGRLSG
jgi:hypothetical protein